MQATIRNKAQESTGHPTSTSVARNWSNPNSVSLGYGAHTVILHFASSQQKALFHQIQKQQADSKWALGEDRQLSLAQKNARYREIESNADTQVRDTLSAEEYGKYMEFRAKTRMNEPYISVAPNRNSNSQQSKAGSPASSTANGNASQLKIQGLVYQDGKPMVLINGKILEAGSWIGNSQIVTITKSNVVVRTEGQEKTFQIH